MKTSDVLTAARTKIEKPENWTKGGLARTLFGDVTSIISPEARKWCAIGAVYAAANANVELGREAELALAEHLGIDLPVIKFNDALNIKHEDVLALFDRAIEAEKEKEALAA